MLLPPGWDHRVQLFVTHSFPAELSTVKHLAFGSPHRNRGWPHVGGVGRIDHLLLYGLSLSLSLDCHRDQIHSATTLGENNS